jgi:hypothetical protein
MSPVFDHDGLKSQCPVNELLPLLLAGLGDVDLAVEVVGDPGAAFRGRIGGPGRDEAGRRRGGPRQELATRVDFKVYGQVLSFQWFMSNPRRTVDGGF